MPFDGNPQRYEPPAGAPFDQVLHDLQVARAKIALGWIQHRQHSGDRYCIYGAIVSATCCNEHRTVAALRELRRAHPPRRLSHTAGGRRPVRPRYHPEDGPHLNSIGNCIRTFWVIHSLTRLLRTAAGR